MGRPGRRIGNAPTTAAPGDDGSFEGSLRSDSCRRADPSRSRHANSSTYRPTAHIESGRLRIINTPMGQELIAELNSFEVDFTSAGNMCVDVRSEATATL
jgi:hypothetical protein